jgi:hypothetical protein
MMPEGRNSAMRQVLAVAVASSFLVFAAPANADVIVGWHTPNWAANCLVEATVTTRDSTLTCWTPNDGFYVRMTGQSRVKKGYAKNFKGRNDKDWAIGLMSFGEKFRFWSPGFFQYECVSRKTGLTCRNHDGYGWWIGRYKGYRIF